MANGIGVTVTSDTRAYQQGIKSGVLQPMTDVDKVLQEVTQSGDQAGQHLEQSFREQQQATGTLKQELTQLNESIKSGSRSASSSMVNDSHHRTKEVEAGFEEMKQSAAQNAISTAGSFNGSFDSIADGAQGLLSELTAGFGPAGLLVGTVAAAGIGLATTAIDDNSAAVEADKQVVASLATQYEAAGTKGRRAFTDVAQAIKDMSTSTDGSVPITLQDAYSKSAAAGADYRDVVESIASADPAQIQSALRRVDALKDTQLAQYDLARATNQSGEADRRADTAHRSQQAAVTGLQTALRKAAKESTDAGRAQELAAEAGLNKFQQKADLIGLLQKGYTDAASSVTDYIDKESGLFDTAKYIKAMEAKQKALNDYVTNLQKSRLTPEAKAFLDAQGADAAAAMLGGYMHGSRAQQQKLDALWTAAGRQNVDSYQQAVGSDLKGLTFDTPPIRVTPPSRADLERARRSAQDYLNAHPLRASAVAYTPYGKPILG